MHIRILCIHVIAASLALASSASPVGTWRTIDDKTHKPRGTVRIYEENGAYFGKIETSVDPAERDGLCEKCPGDRHNQPVIGLVIMRGLTKHGNEYSGGDILDPDTGAVYRCRMTVSDDGEKLTVRGFIGFSLIGRSQVWIRQAAEVK